MDVYRIEPTAYNAEREQARADARSGFVVHGAERAGDRLLGTIQPQHEFYRTVNQVSVRAGILGSPVEDLYVTPRDFLSDGRLSLAVSINPLAMWLWIAGPIFILGTVVALWPNPALENSFARSAAQTRSIANTTATAPQESA